MNHFTEIVDEQRSPAWFAARCGRATGSRASDILATIKSGEAAARRDYRAQLVCERLTSVPIDDTFINKEMQRGIDLEPAARAAYEAATGTMVRTTGFLAHNDILTGCSIDGDTDDYTGIIELKCPKAATHYRYLMENRVPPDYLPQITHNLWMTGANFCDFGSFDDRFPAHLRLFVMRVNASDLDLIGYEAKLIAFLDEVARDVKLLEGRK
jgi:hypothetical protein